MKHTMFLTMLAAALLGSGVANAAGTLYAKDYKGGEILLDTDDTYGKLVVDVPLSMGADGYLDLYNGATIEFLADNSGSICSISIIAKNEARSVYFNLTGTVYNITFDTGAQGIVAASAGSPITLIEDLNKESKGFAFWNTTPEQTTLTLNGVAPGGKVDMGGVQFTYVGPKGNDYDFQTGQIGFTGYENGSHALNLVVGGSPTPEPTTGTLGLLALAALSARRRKK